MRPSENIPSTIQHIYDALLVPDGLPRALAAIAQATRAHRAGFTVGSPIPGKPAVDMTFGFDAEIRNRFNHLGFDNIPMAYRCAPVGQVRRRSDLLSTRDFKRSVLYCDVIRPSGGFEGMVVPISVNATQTTHLAVDRYQGARDFSDRDVKALQTLIPHWTTAWQLHQRLNQAQIRANQASAALDYLDSGVIFVDASMKPVYLNARAQQIAAQGNGLLIGKDRVSACTPDETRSLQRAMATAIRLSAASVDWPIAAPVRLRISRGASYAPLVVSVVPVRAGSTTWLPHTSGSAALFIMEPDRPPDIDVVMLAITYSLAPREAELAARLASGADLLQAAAALRIGIGTARWYLKRVLEKTDTHRQAELVSLIIRGFADHAV